MPMIDYECRDCGALQTVQYRVAEVGGPSWPPTCAECAGELEYARCPAPAVDAREPMQQFTVHRQVPVKTEGGWTLQQRREEIGSLRQIRKLEADSEQRYTNGEGEPLRFRAYANNGSNLDVNSFGEAGSIGGRAYDSGQQPQKHQNLGVVRHGTQRPTIKVARHAGESALK